MKARNLCSSVTEVRHTPALVTTLTRLASYFSALNLFQHDSTMTSVKNVVGIMSHE